MKIKIYRDVNKYAVESTIKVEDVELLKKYNPAALKIKDDKGNDKFAVGYTAGTSSIAKHGVSFGVKNEAGYAVVTGDLPAKTEKPAEYVADLVGGAAAFLAALEETVPEAAAKVNAERAALISTVETV